MMHSLMLRIALIVGLISPASALAALIAVNTLDDEANADGDCSLREAVQAANLNMAVDQCDAGDAAGDTIFINQPGTLTLDSALQISERVAILGAGREALTISGGNSTGLFVIKVPDDTHDVTLQSMTLADASETLPGPAVWVQRVGTLRLELVRLSGNQTADGGGAMAVQLSADSNDISRIEIVRCIFENNTAQDIGGAVLIGGPPVYRSVDSLSIEETRFSANRSTDDAGALWVRNVRASLIDRSVFEANRADDDLVNNQSGGAIGISFGNSFQIANTTFVDNYADSGGGALYVLGDVVVGVENSTFSGNATRQDFGAAIRLRGDATAAVFYSTFIDNQLSPSSSRSVLSMGETSTLSLGHSIVRSIGSESSPQCDITFPDGTFNSLGYNIDTGTSCTGEPTDQPSTDPDLGPLADYGDSSSWVEVHTALPFPDSPAVDGGGSGPCTGLFGAAIDSDQRGEPRPVAGSGGSTPLCDIGATELQAGEAVPRTVAVTLAGTSTGQVTSDPAGINCPAQDCTATFPGGGSVTLTASVGPSPGVVFAGWSGDCAGTGDCLLTLDADKTVTATFNTVTDDLFRDRFESTP